MLNDSADNPDLSLTQLAHAAVAGSIPAGPEIHQRPPVSLRGESEVTVVSPLCASSLSFTLHAATTVSAHDARAREALARYILRPPLAQERLHWLPDNLVRVELKRAFRDGTIAIDLDPLSLLCRLAAATHLGSPNARSGACGAITFGRNSAPTHGGNKTACRSRALRRVKLLSITRSNSFVEIA